MQTRATHILYFVFVLVLSEPTVAQHYFGYSSGNYAGVQALYFNPAAAHACSQQLDIQVAGFDFNFNNSLVAIKKSALSYPDLPSSWQNKTPNVPDNIFKNFVNVEKHTPHAIALSQRVSLPSFSIRLNSKLSFGFTAAYRQYANAWNISNNLSQLIYQEFDLSILQNNSFTCPNLSAVYLSWLEYGANVSYSVKSTDKLFIQLGITAKLLQGLESAYFLANRADFYLSTVDTSSYLYTDFSLARSQGSSGAVNLSPNFIPQYKHAASVRPAADIGMVIYYQPSSWQINKGIAYKAKFAFSIVDIGAITFRKQPNYYDLNVEITQTDILRYMGASNAAQVKALLRSDFPPNTGSPTFKTRLPTSINASADYAYSPSVFFNLAVHSPLLGKSVRLKVYDFTVVDLSVRYQTRNFEIALPLYFDALSAKRGNYLQPGISVRIGPFTVGSTNLSALYKKNLAAVNLYAALKLPVFQKKN